MFYYSAQRLKYKNIYGGNRNAGVKRKNKM